MARIVVVGSSNTDLTVLCPELPSPGQTVLGTDFYTAAGGKGANQAVAAARAGAEVTLVAAVGDDDFGRAALAGFRREGINTKFVAVKRGTPSGAAVIVVGGHGAENLIAVAPGANARLTPADVSRAAAAIRRADLVLLQLEIPLESAERAKRIARAAGVPVMLNPAPMPAGGLPPKFLAGFDCIVPNRGELERLAGGRSSSPGAAAAKLFRLGVRALVVTMGASGVLVVTAEGREVVPGFRVKPVDTVGAGDCFCGNLATALGEGRPLPEAARLACAAAAISVTRRGAQSSMPRRAEATRLLTKGRI